MTIAELRKKCNLSQAEFASLLGLDNTTICKYENGLLLTDKSKKMLAYLDAGLEVMNYNISNMQYSGLELGIYLMNLGLQRKGRVS